MPGFAGCCWASTPRPTASAISFMSVPLLLQTPGLFPIVLGLLRKVAGFQNRKNSKPFRRPRASNLGYHHSGLPGGEGTRKGRSGPVWRELPMAIRAAALLLLLALPSA